MSEPLDLEPIRASYANRYLNDEETLDCANDVAVLLAEVEPLRGEVAEVYGELREANRFRDEVESHD